MINESHPRSPVLNASGGRVFLKVLLKPASTKVSVTHNVVI